MTVHFNCHTLHNGIQRVGKQTLTIRRCLRLARITHLYAPRGNARVFAFLLKQTTALITIFQIKLSFIKLQLYDIKMLDLSMEPVYRLHDLR